jgi:23S rRNA pseudouridine2605 synthase
MLERLQKIIAHAGIASRRHAEQLILSGQVSVNGQIVRELGTKADPTIDKIEAAGRLVEEARKSVYLIMHKPPDVVSSLADPGGRKTLRNFLRGFPERVYPVGNLDYAASGLIFLTNDGELTDNMLKSWSNIPQVYHIKVKGRLNLDELDALGSKTGTIIRVVRQPDSTRGHAQNFWYEAQLAGAKLDYLAATLQKALHPVEKVKRIGLGPLSLEGVPVGHYVVLSKEQVEALSHPTRPLKFAPHPRPKPEGRPEFRPVPAARPPRRPEAPASAQHFSNPPTTKPGQRPARYTKFQRRPSTPANAREDFVEMDDERLDATDNRPGAPWLTTSRPASPPTNPSAKYRGGRDSRSGSKPFRPKVPRNFSSSNKPDRSGGSSDKFNRPANSTSKFSRPGNFAGKFRRPANPSSKFNRPGNSSNRFDRPSRPAGKSSRPPSGRPKSPRNFNPRKPRPPR